MSKYKIKISYTTGDSFHTEDTFDYLELDFNDLDIAKENLQRISEHYKMYKELNYNYYRDYSREEIIAENINKPWFVNMPKLFCISTGNAMDEKYKQTVGIGNWEYRPDSYYSEHCLKLKADNGNEMQISAFWSGYFETLNCVEIVVDESDMKINF